MATAPSLSEITNIKGDADIAFGTAGQGGTDVVLKPNEGMQMLQAFAQMKAQHDANKYKTFQENMANFYKGLGDINLNDIMMEDNNDLKQDYANVLADVADNMDVIMNPMKDPSRYGAISQKIGALRSDIAKSANQNKYFQEQDKMLSQNSLYNTETNRALIKTERAKKLKERGIPTLQQSYMMDPLTIREAATKAAEQQYAKDEINNTLVPGKQYLISSTGKKYDPDIFRNTYRNLLSGTRTEKNGGKSYLDILRSTYDNDEGLKARYASADEYVDQWINDQKPNESVVTQTAAPEKYAYLKEQQAFQAAQQAKQLAQQWRIHSDNLALQKQIHQDNLDAQGLGGGGKGGVKLAMGREKNKALAMMMYGQQIDQAVGQNAFGNDREIDIEIPGENGTKTKTKIPEYHYINNGLDEKTGKVVINGERWDLKKGKYVPDVRYMTQDEADNALNGMFGKTGRAAVEDNSALWRKQQKLDDRRFNAPQVSQYFGMDTTQGGAKYNPTTGQMMLNGVPINISGVSSINLDQDEEEGGYIDPYLNLNQHDRDALFAYRNGLGPVPKFERGDTTVAPVTAPAKTTTTTTPAGLGWGKKKQ